MTTLYRRMIKGAICVILLAGCGVTPGPIAPATLPEPAASYEDAGRSFSAPARGEARWDGDDAAVVYGGRAKLTVTSAGGTSEPQVGFTQGLLWLTPKAASSHALVSWLNDAVPSPPAARLSKKQ